MHKETITYVDFNGTERTEDHYFNLSKTEITELEVSMPGGLAEYLMGIVNAKPQRFLKSGDIPVIVRTTSKLRNPTGFKSLPIIKVNGSGKGNLRIGDYVITISNISSYLTIDSELQDAYKGTTNCNSLVTLSNGFPKLIKGENEISFSGGITSVEVIPKWWTL